MTIKESYSFDEIKENWKEQGRRKTSDADILAFNLRCEEKDIERFVKEGKSYDYDLIRDQIKGFENKDWDLMLKEAEKIIEEEDKIAKEANLFLETLDKIDKDVLKSRFTESFLEIYKEHGNAEQAITQSCEEWKI